MRPFGSRSDSGSLMRSYANQSTKVQRFLARNRGQLVRGFLREVSTKAYLRPWVRAIVRPFVRAREPQRWVFLVGCYNSGTTILREILEAHPQISALPFEGVRLTNAFPDLEASDWPRMMYQSREIWDLPDAGAARRVARAKADWALWWGRSAKIFLEKSIDNTTRIAWLRRHFGKTTFIAITRNGYCVAEGILRRSKPQGEAIREVGETYPLSMIADQWVAFEDKMVAELDPQGGDIHMTYEDLMRDPVPILKEVFAALDLAPPELVFEGTVLTVGPRKFDLVDQNAQSLSRLAPEDVKTLSEGMGPSLRRRGYGVVD